jgi:hypothetical protein
VVADPPRIDAGDLLVDLPRLLADAPSDATLAIFHSAVLAYLNQQQRHRFTDVMGAVKRTRDVHWVSNEEPGVIRGADRNPRPQGRFILAPRPGTGCRDRTTWPQPRLASITPQDSRS